MIDHDHSTNDDATAADRGARRPWDAPRILSSDAFTRAALACCEVYIEGVPTGEFQDSQGTGLPAC